jgi:hypothetical protein
MPVFTAVICFFAAVIPEQQNGIHHADIVEKNSIDFPT